MLQTWHAVTDCSKHELRSPIVDKPRIRRTVSHGEEAEHIVCLLGRDRDSGSATSGRRCTARKELGRQPTSAVHHTRSVSEIMPRIRFGVGHFGAGRSSMPGALQHHTRQTVILQSPNQDVVVYRVEGWQIIDTVDQPRRCMQMRTFRWPM